MGLPICSEGNFTYAHCALPAHRAANKLKGNPQALTMRTVLWDRVRGLQDTVTALPIPFIGRAARTDAGEADEVEQAARLLAQQQSEQLDIEQPLLESTAPAL